MCSTDTLMNEFGAALQFFEGFGEDWPELTECLSYLDEWMPAEAYVLVVERAEEVLADEPDDLPALVSALHSAGRFFSDPVTTPDRVIRPAIPFRALFSFSRDAGEDALDRLLLAASRDEVPIHVDPATPGGLVIASAVA